VALAMRKHFFRHIINQIRVGDLIHRSKMLSQPPVLLRESIDSNQGVDRHNNSTCLRFMRIYDHSRVTADIFRQIPFVSAPIQVRVCKVSVGEFPVRNKLIKIRDKMRIIRKGRCSSPNNENHGGTSSKLGYWGGQKSPAKNRSQGEYGQYMTNADLGGKKEVEIDPVKQNRN